MATPMKPGQRYRGYYIDKRYFEGVRWKVSVDYTYQQVGKKVFDEREELVTKIHRVDEQDN